MGETEKENRLSDLLDLQRLQKLQDNLAKALGLAFVTVDYRGRPVTQSSGFTGFCRCLANHGQYGDICRQCYAHAGLHATMAGKPHIYRCHAGLVEFAVPLLMDGKYLGSVIGGQCELTSQSSGPEPVLPQMTNWEENPELSRNRSSVHKITWEKLESTVDLVQDILRNLLEEEQNRSVREELHRKNRELMEEKAARANLELSQKQEELSGPFAEQLDKDHLFYMLNVISRLAFLEKAEETERTVCDFAAMMRYVLENEAYNFVTLGEELEYIDYYLQIQRRRTAERLHYEISVPETCYSILCPFMMLYPLVKNTVKYVQDNSRDGGSLSIRAREEQDVVLVSIACDCAGVSGQKVGLALDLESKRKGSPLERLDRSLKQIFDRNCGVTSGDRQDGQPGKEIQIRLPLNSGTVEKYEFE